MKHGPIEVHVEGNRFVGAGDRGQLHLLTERGAEQLVGTGAEVQARLEEFGQDDPVGTHDIGTGEWDPEPWVVLPVDQRVEDAKAFDDLAVGVGQQGKRDVVRARIVSQRSHLVVAEGVEGDTGVRERLGLLLQLDQLRATRRSPDR